jgi:hypothetical protein
MSFSEQTNAVSLQQSDGVTTGTKDQWKENSGKLFLWET